MVLPRGWGLQERCPLVHLGGKPGADWQGADAGHLEVFLPLHLGWCVGSMPPPTSGGGLGRPLLSLAVAGGP